MWKQEPRSHVTMSVTILVDSKVRPVDVAVFAALCSYGGSKDPSVRRWAWPSIDAIQTRSAGLKRTAVKASLNRLEAWGYIINRIPRGHKGRSTTMYSFQ